MQVLLPDATLGPLDVPLLRVAGSTMVISCAVEYCLKVREIDLYTGCCLPWCTAAYAYHTQP